MSDILNINMSKFLIFLLPFFLLSCAGEVENCVEAEMVKFYAEKKSGRQFTDIIYKDDGSILKKKKRTAEEHEKLMRNSCLKKRFKKD